MPRDDDDDVVIVAALSDMEPSDNLRFRLPARYAPSPEAMADALFPVGLLLAMATNQKLVLEAPISKNCWTVQRRFKTFTNRGTEEDEACRNHCEAA
jgi:hypothetical protein